jgi:hypothetical protein
MVAAMPAAIRASRPNPLADLEPDAIDGEWARRGLDRLSDAELVEAAAERLAVPRVEPADSFVLHAPLELLARAGLLGYVDPASREDARRRIAWLAATYDAQGAGVDDPVVPGEDRDAGTDTGWLASAVDAGDLEAVDRATVALCSSATAADLAAALVDVVVPRLSAAAHGSIFLNLLPRLLAANAPAATMARGLLRELARNPDWSLTWIDARDAHVFSQNAPAELTERLLAPPSPGDPGSNFIYPTMSLVDRSGLAARVLDDVTACLSVADARRSLLRVAAMSMLQDDPAAAPYGWTHCLTMPQATLGVARISAAPERAVAVAATYVLGFRSTLSRVALDTAWEPVAGETLGPDGLLEAGASEAAAALWHADDEATAGFVRRVATHAALHHDAHLAKYTLACIDAARDDPDASRLFLTAAAYLGGWWRTNES